MWRNGKSLAPGTSWASLEKHLTYLNLSFPASGEGDIVRFKSHVSVVGTQYNISLISSSPTYGLLDLEENSKMAQSKTHFVEEEIRPKVFSHKLVFSIFTCMFFILKAVFEYMPTIKRIK